MCFVGWCAREVYELIVYKCIWWLLFSSFTSKMLIFVCVKYRDHARFIASRSSYVMCTI